MKLYIAVLDEVPDFIVPTIVAHSMLGAHLTAMEYISGRTNAPYEDVDKFINYTKWLSHSFKKCVVSVNKKEFEKISELKYTYLGHENKTLNGVKCCAIPFPVPDNELPNVLKFAKLWKPKFGEYRQGCLECDETRVNREKNMEWKEDLKRGREIVQKLAIEEFERKQRQSIAFDTLPDDYEVN